MRLLFFFICEIVLNIVVCIIRLRFSGVCRCYGNVTT